MLTEVAPTRYVVKVNGITLSPIYFTEATAQQFILNLSQEQQKLAEVVIVSQDGKELLFG